MLLIWLAEAVKLAARVGHLFVATVDDTGIPHLAIAEQIRIEGEDLVTVTAWFCPRTAQNIEKHQYYPGGLG